MSDVAHILSQIESGDPSAAEKLLPLVYDELRRLSAARLAQVKPGQTLQATALVHEAYLLLVVSQGDLSWDCRGHFFAAAAEAMRRILVERARARQSQEHGGDRHRRGLTDEAWTFRCDASGADRILAIHEALSELASRSPRQAQLVKLRFFAGMTLEESATVLAIAPHTAIRDWAAARIWLYRRLSDG